MVISSLKTIIRQHSKVLWIILTILLIVLVFRLLLPLYPPLQLAEEKISNRVFWHTMHWRSSLSKYCYYKKENFSKGKQEIDHIISSINIKEGKEVFIKSDKGYYIFNPLGSLKTGIFIAFDNKGNVLSDKSGKLLVHKYRFGIFPYIEEYHIPADLDLVKFYQQHKSICLIHIPPPKKEGVFFYER